MAKPPRRTPPPAANTQPELVDPRWLLRMVGGAIVAALVCGYLTLGLLFHLGAWQIVLHPTHNPGGGTGLATEKVRFSPDRAGSPQLTGEWLPAPVLGTHPGMAVLFLRGGDGQLDAGDGTQMAALHDLGLAVFAFDYRGYGSSTQPHPNEARMLEDAEAAWNYVSDVRKSRVLVFGSGIGASLAAQVARAHGNTAGLIAYNADTEVFARVLHDPRGALFPVRLLVGDRFSLDALQSLPTPKLLYTVGPLNPARTAVYRSAAEPRLSVEVPTHNAEQEHAALARFLDSYVR